MDKHSKTTKHQSLHQGGADTKKNTTSSPSVDVNGKPVAENDNSANLFEEHILQQENKSQR